MKLKVCGMKYKSNIEAVANLQPDYLGFIFYEKSSRLLKETIPKLPESIKKVGVFVNESIDFIKDKIEAYNLDCIQLHGNETPEYCLELNSNCHSEQSEKSHRENLNQVQIVKKIELIKVFSIKDDFNFSVLKPYEDVCDYYLFDTKGKLPGGNGYTFNWNILNNYSSTKPFFLSGGIGLSEIETINAFKRTEVSKFCHVIDVNSKFEIQPGLKNIKELETFKNEL